MGNTVGNIAGGEVGPADCHSGAKRAFREGIFGSLWGLDGFAREVMDFKVVVIVLWWANGVFPEALVVWRGYGFSPSIKVN